MDAPVTLHAAMGLENLPVGTLWTHQGAASFRYADDWLRHPHAYPLEPALPLAAHPHHTRPEQALFASMADSTPDRWGQILIQRNHAASRVNSTLRPRDYLLGVSDLTRIGALRYSEEGSAFLAPGTGVPPLTRLGDLMAAAHKVHTGNTTPTELELLLSPGSSLGGARPKSNVIDQHGVLHIAKFDHPQDTYSVILWEGATLQMAADIGLNVPAFRLLRVGINDVLLLRRFDRQGTDRLPYISALTMLDAPTAESGSYVALAHAIRQHSADATADLHELWSRLAFTILVTNTDNHLRNHAFIRHPGSAGWTLAPAYDINPTPRTIKPRILTLPVENNDATASLETAIAVSPQFGLKLSDAKLVIRNMSRITSRWRSYAAKVGITAGDIAFMETAFEHSELATALRI